MNIEILWCPEGGRLVVTLPDCGTLIRCELATDTFVEAIKRIGIVTSEGPGDRDCRYSAYINNRLSQLSAAQSR